MRATTIAVSLLAVVVVAALLVARGRGEGAAPETRGTASMVGDSLNVGVEPFLAAELPGWSMLTDDHVGRLTAGGIEALESGRARLAPYLVVSLGTNDPPEDVEGFRIGVARLLRFVGPDRCVVWATIWRDGEPSTAFNDVLKDAAESNRRLRLVDWAGMVEDHPERLAPDGLHGSAAGYRARAAAIAEAVRSCAPART